MTHSNYDKYEAFEEQKATCGEGQKVARSEEQKAACSAAPALSENEAAAFSDDDFMMLALAQAEYAKNLGEVPVGAIVVYEPKDPATGKPLALSRILSHACNLRETTNNPAAHAEFLAMQAAARKLNSWRLGGCTVYVTLEPCIMCAGLMHQARIDRCVYGAADPKAGALGSLYSIHADTRLNHTFGVTPGVLAEKSTQLLRQFFKDKRKK